LGETARELGVLAVIFVPLDASARGALGALGESALMVSVALGIVLIAGGIIVEAQL